MNVFREASRLKLRFNTSKGLLSTEQLWDLPQSTLATAIKNVKKALKKDDDDDLAFLDDTKVINKEDQIAFDVLKEVYQTKKSEMEAIKDKAETKAHNEKIMALIAEKQEESLKSKSLDELQSLLK